MTLKQRLILLISSAALGLIVLAGLSAYQIERVFTITNYSNVNSLPSVRVLQEAYVPLASIRAQVWQHITLEDKGRMAEIEGRINTNMAKLEDSLKRYESLVSDEKDRQLLRDDRDALEAYRQVREQTMALSRENRMAQARDYLLANQAAFNRINDAFLAHLQYNLDLGTQSAKEAESLSSAAEWQSAVLSGITLVLVVGLGILIMRSVSRQLGADPAMVAACVDRVAQGDLSQDIPLEGVDKDALLANVVRMQTAVRSLIDDMNHMSREHDLGDIDVIVPVEKYQGGRGEQHGGRAHRREEEGHGLRRRVRQGQFRGPHGTAPGQESLHKPRHRAGPRQPQGPHRGHLHPGHRRPSGPPGNPRQC